MQATICAMLREKIISIKNNSNDGDFKMQKQQIISKQIEIKFLIIHVAPILA